MSYVKITSLLALASTAAAVPHYPHGRFHNRAYPTAGWTGSYNATAVAGATGTGAYDDGKTTTLGMTSTSTQTLYSTIYAIPSSAAAEDVDVADVSTGQCGGTVTVTASEQVTVTVTPGGGAAIPTSLAAAVDSSAGNAYSAPSPLSPVAEASSAGAGYPAETPVEQTSSAVETAVAETSSAAKTTTSAAETPVAETTTSVAETTSSAAGYSAVTPEASTSSQAAYITPSLIQKPVQSASATSSSAAATSSAASGNTYTGAKRGLAYNEASLCTSFGSKFGFGYNWGQTESNDIGTNFIPMMHGPSKSTAEEWLSNVDKAVENGSTAVMGFNECDHAAQCNLAPEAACSAWKQYMNPVKEAHPDVTIIGPSITNGQAPMGLDWLTRFQSCCADATIDASNMHWYDDHNEGVLGRFKDQVDAIASLYGKKVWVTEFGLNAGTATDEEAASFLKEAMAYLDSSDKVQGYSWFMVGGTGPYSLNGGDGLSAIGQIYASS
jgi:hypothetical protein